MGIRHFTSDGILGTVFERKGLQAIFAEVEKVNIGTIIVKDMSRLGRSVTAVTYRIPPPPLANGQSREEGSWKSKRKNQRKVKYREKENICKLSINHINQYLYILTIDVPPKAGQRQWTKKEQSKQMIVTKRKKHRTNTKGKR